MLARIPPRSAGNVCDCDNLKKQGSAVFLLCLLLCRHQAWCHRSKCYSADYKLRGGPANNSANIARAARGAPKPCALCVNSVASQSEGGCELVISAGAGQSAPAVVACSHTTAANQIRGESIQVQETAY